eukprot:3729169-Rhodomonas_salina.1
MPKVHYHAPKVSHHSFHAATLHALPRCLELQQRCISSYAVARTLLPHTPVRRTTYASTPQYHIHHYQVQTTCNRGASWYHGDAGGSSDGADGEEVILEGGGLVAKERKGAGTEAVENKRVAVTAARA